MSFTRSLGTAEEGSALWILLFMISHAAVCFFFFSSPEHSFSMRHCCVRFNFSEALNQNWWRHIKRKHLRLPLFSVTITPCFSACSLWTATQMKSCCSTYRKSQNDNHHHHHGCMFFYFCMTQKTLYASQSDLVYKICGQILFILRSPVRDMGKRLTFARSRVSFARLRKSSS